MANSFGTLAVATILQEALALVFTKRPELNLFSKGFTDRNGVPIASFGQTVYTRIHTIPALQSFGAAAPAVSDTDVPIVLNWFPQLAYRIAVDEYSSTTRNLVQERAEPMARGIANSIVDSIASVVTKTNFGNTSAFTNKTAWTDPSYDSLTALRSTLNQRGVPEDGQFVIVNSPTYAALKGDPMIVAELNNAANSEAIKTGKLPVVQDFQISEYPAIPLTIKAADSSTGAIQPTVLGGSAYGMPGWAAHATELIGFAGSKDAIAWASRVPSNPTEVMAGITYPGRIEVVVEPMTGFRVMAIMFINQTDLSVNMVVTWMHGFAPGNTNNLQVLTSS